MAISTVPTITGPNFGGIIYGLNLNLNYSDAPSILKLNIVNKNGVYNIPADWSRYCQTPVNVSFGDFKFIGFPWRYSFKETAAEKTLEVDLIDGSVILDRYYVLLWKPYILGDPGESFSQTRGIDLSTETVLTPIFSSELNSIVFEEKALATQNVTRSMSRAGKNNKGGGIKGNIIYLGTEMFKNSRCDLPSTFYTLEQLANQANSLDGINLNPLIRGLGTQYNSFQGTYEGTLREVLNSWCTDLGFNFYWDCQTNEIEFYDTKNGIRTNFETLEKIKSDNLIEKTSSKSMEGTYRQYALAYTAKPREPLKTLSASYNYSVIVPRNPIAIEWFLKRNGIKESPYSALESGDGDAPQDNVLVSLAGDRYREEDVYASAFLGYIDQNLRNLWCTARSDWAGMGMAFYENVDGSKDQILQELKKTNPDDIEKLEKIDAKGLTNYIFDVVVFNQGGLEFWQKTEGDILTQIGSTYRIPDQNSSFFFCTSKSVIEVDVNVTPEGQLYEGNSPDFKGLRLYNRGGKMDRSAADLVKALGLLEEENIVKISQALNTHVPISKEVSDIISQVITTNIPEDAFLLIRPNNQLYNKILKTTGNNGIKVIVRKGTNNMEKTAAEASSEGVKSQKNNCRPFDDRVRSSSCIGAREEASEISRNQLMPPPNSSKLYSGLVSKRALGAEISVFGNTETVHAPSDAKFFVVINYNISAQSISSLSKLQYIYFRLDGNSNNPTANDVEKIDVLYDNVTDSFLDTFGSERDQDKIPTAKSISNINPQENFNFVFAGNPDPNLPLSIKNGLSSLDISYSTDGFKTSIGYSSRPPQKPKNETVLRKVQSQLNRASFNAT